MAAPNLLALTTMTAKSYQAELTNTLTTDLVTNSAASGKVFKVESIFVANIDGTSSVDVTVGIIKSGGSVKMLASTVPVAADSTYVLSDKNTPIYLEEGDLIEGGASANGDAVITINYIECS